MSLDYHAVASRLIERAPFVATLARTLVPSSLRAWLYRRNFETRIANSNDPRQVFENIYRANWWQSEESRSGPGSELAVTEQFRAVLADWMMRHRSEVKTFLDAPCGDFNWMRHVPLPDTMSYIGGDIVPALIEDIQQRYGSHRHSFMTLDIVEDALPHADAWLCRDVLFHLPLAMGQKVCEAFEASDTRYFLSTTFPDVKNDEDIKVGWYRQVNLEIAPFNLGKPDELLPDIMIGDKMRYVGVWKNKRFA